MLQNIQKVIKIKNSIKSYNNWGGGKSPVIAVILKFILFIFILALASCSNSLQYVKDSSKFSSFDLDYHDIESVIDKNVKSFSKSNFMKRYNAEKKAVIAISNIDNLSGENIDTEFISRKLIRKLSSYEQIVLTNAVVGSGAKADKMIEGSRKLTKNENFNQYTTKEKGTILAPEYSLSGKITKNIKNIGKKERVDYQFIFIISDLDSGREVWSNDVLVSKVINKEDMGKYSTTENIEAKKYNEIGQTNYKNGDYGKAKKYFKKACKLGLREACDSVVKAENSYKEAEIAKSSSSNTDSTFGLVLAKDFGVGGNTDTNMPTTPYTYTKENKTIDIYQKNSLAIYPELPSTTRIGGYFKKYGLYVEASFLFRQVSTFLHHFSLGCIEKSKSNCSVRGDGIQGINIQHVQTGGNLRIGYGATLDFVSLTAYIGGGGLVDSDSKMTVKGDSEYTNKLTKNINGTYPFWEIGAFMTFWDSFFVDTSFRYVFQGDANKYWISSATYNFSLGVFLNKSSFRLINKAFKD